MTYTCQSKSDPFSPREIGTVRAWLQKCEYLSSVNSEDNLFQIILYIKSRFLIVYHYLVIFQKGTLGIASDFNSSAD